jgi:histidinol phosphatase-like enzyme (inositol monophosphatase family)
VDGNEKGSRSDLRQRRNHILAPGGDVVSHGAFLDFAIDAAWQAGRLVLGYFQRSLAVDRKADESPVTVADREGERLLRHLIETRFPAHAIVGEEMGASNAGADHRWILDPIDGTQSYIRGVPLFGVLVGLEIEGEMAVGVAHYPALGEMVAAAKGLGCRWNGRPARVSTTERLADALLLCTDSSEMRKHAPISWHRLENAVRLQRGWSDCYGYALVATGRADLMLDAVMKPWDCAALLPILQEAGGSFTDWGGRATIDGGNGLATNGRLLDETLSLLAGGR